MIHIENLTMSFGKKPVLRDFDLDLPAGEILGLLGPNGAGKSTLLRLLIGQLRPTSGSIRLFGDSRPGASGAKRRLGYMPQDLAVYRNLTVLENLAFFARLYGLRGQEVRRRCQAVLEQVELGDKGDELVRNLSGGMVRRTLLASCTVHQPELLILDEPTAGVDPVLRRKFWRWLVEWCRGGVSIIVTTHHIAEARDCGRVVFLREGSKVEEGSPAVLLRKYGAGDLEQAFVAATSGGG